MTTEGPGTLCQERDEIYAVVEGSAPGQFEIDVVMDEGGGETFYDDITGTLLDPVLALEARDLATTTLDGQEQAHAPLACSRAT